MLARISHQGATATAHLRALARELAVRLLDVGSTTPAVPNDDFSCESTKPHRLATHPGEKSGLAPTRFNEGAVAMARSKVERLAPPARVPPGRQAAQSAQRYRGRGPFEGGGRGLTPPADRSWAAGGGIVVGSAWMGSGSFDVLAAGFGDEEKRDPGSCRVLSTREGRERRGPGRAQWGVSLEGSMWRE